MAEETKIETTDSPKGTEDTETVETETEEVEDPETIEADPAETDKQKIERLDVANKKLFARAKKAEGFVQDSDGNWIKKPKTEAAPTTRTSTASTPTVEETVLLVNGMPEELLAELKVIAKVRNVSLVKAQKDPIFVAVKDKFEKDAKQRDAAVGSPRGSGGMKPKKDFNTPNLTREEHQKMFNQKQGTAA